MTDKAKQESNLAVDGMTSIRDKILPYGRQTISDEDIEAVSNVLESDWLTTGPEIEKFEREFASFIGTKYAVAYSNGTAALHGAYFAAGIDRGDEIVTSGMTFAATGNAAIYLGATPVFADIEEDTGNIDPLKVSNKLTTRSKAIVGIDYYGQPCEADQLKEIAHSNGLKFIIDAAHSLGALYKGKKAGSLADMSTFSFHPVKSITTGEGGMVVTDSEELYEKLATFRTHGIVKDPAKLRNKNEGPWYHEMQHLGYNYRITDFQCALGRRQLRRLPEFIERRRDIAKKYRCKLKDVSYIQPAVEKEHCQPAYHLFPILIKKEPRAKFRKLVFEALRKKNIGVQVHYIPVYQHPYYLDNISNEKTDCPNTDAFYNGEISLPIFPSMTERDIDDVVQALLTVASKIL